MSDQELDDLFKEALTKYEAPFDEKEWEKMAALLDSPPSFKPGFWNWKIISGLALLLLISSTVLTTQWDKINGGAEKSGNKTSKSIAPPNEEVSSSKVNDNKKAESNENLSSDDAVTESTKENDSIIKSNNTEQESVSSQLANSSSSQSLRAKRTSGKEDNEQLKTKTFNESSKIQRKELITEKIKGNNESAASFDGENKKQQQTSTTILSNSPSDKSSTKNSSVLTMQQSTNKKLKASEKESVVSNGENAAAIVSTNSKNEKGSIKSEKIVSNGNDDVNNEKESVSLLKGSKPIAVAEEPKESSSATAILNNSSERSENDSDKLLSSSTSLNKASWEKSSDSSVVATSVIKKDSAINKEVAKKKESKKSDSIKIDPFSVKLALSPDFSSIGYFKPGKTGFNYGLLAEYNITRHWSVTLGGIWSRKIYTGTMTENAGYGTLNSTYIDGSCRVLDLPLNINYYIMPQNAFSLYGSIGLSSYFMFDEDYTYDYVYGTKQYSYSKKIDRGNTEWFRMMNLSIGIQQQLSPRMRLQLEPFIKAPLSGIGGGDLKLVSSGVFLNLKYTFK